MGKRKTIVIVAEGAQDRNLTKITPSMVKDVLSSEPLKLDTRITTLGHVQRGGTACAYDRMLSTLQGAEAVNAVLDAKPDTPSPMIAIIENKICRRPLVDAVAATKSVAQAISEKDFQKAMSLRDAEFDEYFTAYLTTASTDSDQQKIPEEKVCRRVQEWDHQNHY
jgi:6-phosphofructokinase 1